MASQLIYTSAPRLLEAGRTGFGTVARHRSVSGLLAAAVERFSQFARLPGHDPKRVIHSHRLVTVGASTFHVLSCLRDAGSDYTGRTNHIAHHLIADEREVRALAAGGITPADVLLAMPWRETWTEAARFLEPADEVDLAELRAGSSWTWEAATGDQANARLPWLPGARKGCYVIAPDGVPMLPLFQEALHEKIQQSWQVTFTTSLEPNDDVGDFRWIGVAASSPLRMQLENSVRQVFDLEAPGSLPPPPEAEVPAAMPMVPPRPAGTLPPPPPTLASPAKETLPAPHLRTRGGVPPPSLAELPPPSAPQAEGQMLGGWSPEPRSRRGGKSRMPLVLGALVVLLLAAGAGLVYFKLQQDQENLEGGRLLTEQIKTLWRRHDLKLPNTLDSLVERAQNADEAGREELKKVLAAYAAKFKEIDASLADPDIPYKDTSPDGNHQEDLVGLWKVVGEWTKNSAGAIAERWLPQSKPAEMSSEVESWLKQREKLWKECADFFNPTRPQPDAKPEWQKFLVKAAEILGGETKPAGTPKEWRDLMTRIENGLERKPLADVSSWLDAWTSLTKAEGGKSADRVAEIKAIASRPGVPAWLKTMADAQGKKAQAEVVVVKEKEKMPPSAPPVGLVVKPAVDVNSAAADHPIFIKFVPLEEKETTLHVSLLEDHPRPMLSFGGAAPDFASPEKWTFFDPSYRLKRMNVADGEIKINGAVVSLPMRVDAARLVARTEDEKKVLFEARLIASNSPLAPILKFTEVPEFKVSDTNAVQYLNIGRLIQRLQFLKPTSVEYRLSSKHGGSQQFQLSRPTGDAYMLGAIVPPVSTAVGPNLRALEMAIADLEKEIVRLKKLLDDESGKNTAEAQKKEKIASLQTSIGEKQNKLKSQQEKLDALQAPVITGAVRITPGRYILRAHFSSTDVPAVKDVCEIQVNLP